MEIEIEVAFRDEEGNEWPFELGPNPPQVAA